MGVKSTVTLTRADAERRYLDVYVKARTAEREAEVRLMLEHLRHEGGFDLPSMTDKMIRDAYVYVDALKRSLRDREKARTSLAKLVTDRQLQDRLEVLNDRANGGEGFENYLITDHPDD